VFETVPSFRASSVFFPFVFIGGRERGKGGRKKMGKEKGGAEGREGGGKIGRKFGS
jgi:hypothetical protein